VRLVPRAVDRPVADCSQLVQGSPERMSREESIDEVTGRFRAEADLVPHARDWLLDSVSRARDHWLVVDEHLMGTRIPDLLAARVDLRAFRARIRAEQWEPLTEGQIVALTILRSDRPTSVQVVAERVGYTTDSTRRLLRRLEHLGYASESRGRGFRKVRGRYKVFSRFIAVEAKLRDWRRALVQARAHRSFAQECYVAFDASYVDRFTIGHTYFRASGTGLLAVSPADGGVVRVLRPRGSRSVHPTTFATAGEQLWLRLQGVTRPLPQTRLPNAAARIARPGELGSPESRSRSLAKLLADLAQPPRDRRR
jgi:hypothetical protein